MCSLSEFGLVDFTVVELLEYVLIHDHFVAELQLLDKVIFIYPLVLDDHGLVELGAEEVCKEFAVRDKLRCEAHSGTCRRENERLQVVRQKPTNVNELQCLSKEVINT